MSADTLHYVVYGGYISTRWKLKLSHTTFWAALIRESAAGPKRISFYNNHAEFVTGLQPQFFFELRNILHIELVEAKGRARIQRSYRFKIISTSGTQLIATKTAEECQKWVKSMTDLLQGIPEPNVVYEFQIVVLPGGHADKLNLNGLYILKVFESSLKLFSANGNIPTDFHCSLANATIFCTATNIRGSEAGMLMIQTSSNADIGEGVLAFSAKSAVDITKVVEQRKKCTRKVATPRKQRSISLPDLDYGSMTDLSLPHSCPDPGLLADVSQHRCHPNPTKLPRQGVPVCLRSALDLIVFHDSAPGSDKISLQPNSSQQPSLTTLLRGWEPILPPTPWSRPASPNPSQDRPLSPHPNIELSGSHSNSQISTNKATPPTPKSPSNSPRLLLPVSHHHILTHSTKSEVEGSTKALIASPKKVARFPPKRQVKVDDSEPKEGSRNEAAQKRFVYFNKPAGDSGDYEINDVGIGNDKSSAILIKKNLAYRMVDVGIDDKSPPLVLGGELDDDDDGDGYVDIKTGNKKLPCTVEKSTPGELHDYDYIDVDMQIGNDQFSSIVEKNIAREPKSKSHGYMSESAPHIHEQPKAKIRRSNSDLSSRGSVSRKGTIKVYRDPQHTISTQRQLSTEDLNSVCNPNSIFVTPYATFEYSH